ncbi:hypothetical protein GOODEAATRI_022163 [Goodea atripinnis]|uniref:Vomeronasal type-1 receptor n=1 Tax=Goodea atripinnis TaxID=208336 RepID=A0ABV0P6Y3_9TELE
MFFALCFFESTSSKRLFKTPNYNKNLFILCQTMSAVLIICVSSNIVCTFCLCLIEAKQQRFIAAPGIVYVGHMLASLLQLAAHYRTAVISVAAAAVRSPPFLSQNLPHSSQQACTHSK